MRSVLVVVGHELAVDRYQHPVYGRLRVERVQQMSVQGANIGWQLGLVRVT
jgi:hypothetical protein